MVWEREKANPQQKTETNLGPASRSGKGDLSRGKKETRSPGPSRTDSGLNRARNAYGDTKRGRASGLRERKKERGSRAIRWIGRKRSIVGEKRVVTRAPRPRKKKGHRSRLVLGTKRGGKDSFTEVTVHTYFL